MHAARLYIRLMQYCEKAGAVDVIDIPALEKRLQKQIKRSITQDTDQWKTSYICKPSKFFNSKNSIFYANNKEIADFECDFIVETQLEDGSWNVPWRWNDYPNEWAISENWWKGQGIIQNLLYLKGFGLL